MLPARQRFHGHGSLRFVYAKGKVARTPLFICKTTQNRRRAEPRVAVVVSKKISKSAVKRNKIRRRMYEAVRLENIVSPYDIVFIVTSIELLIAPYDNVRSMVHEAMAGLQQ